MNAYETILVDVDRHVATVTLNRPDVLNAFNLQMDKEFFEALWALEADPDVRCIVVTGAGRAFSSGIDLTAGDRVFSAEAHAEHDAALATSSETIADRAALWKMRTPTICAINGAAIGAGCTVPMLFDIRYAADDAKMRFNFTRLGIIPDAGIHWMLPRLVGVSKGLELLLSGRFFSGAEAAEIGLVSRALPREELVPAALELAHDIADNCAPAAVGVTKQLVMRYLESTDRDAAMAEETKLVWWMGTQPDAMEGVMAWMQKRPPDWQVSKSIELPE